MDLEEIKNLIEKDNGKFIIVEDGKAILVMMSFKDYEKIINGYKNNVFEQADLMIEKEKETEKEKEIEREKEMMELRQEIEQGAEPEFTGEQESSGEEELEDLPVR